jgi:hypothetical protein
MGVVECAMMSGLSQLLCLYMFFKAAAFICRYSYCQAVARELWGKVSQRPSVFHHCLSLCINRMISVSNTTGPLK